MQRESKAEASLSNQGEAEQRDQQHTHYKGRDTPKHTPASGLYTILQGNFREFLFHALR